MPFAKRDYARQVLAFAGANPTPSWTDLLARHAILLPKVVDDDKAENVQ